MEKLLSPCVPMLAGLMAVSPRWLEFAAAIDGGVKGTRAASLLAETARHLERKGHDLSGVDWQAIMARDLKKKDEKAAVQEAL